MYSKLLSGGEARNVKASPRRISACDWKPHCSTFDLIVSMGVRLESEKRTNDAPRLKASIPTAPVPANRSHQFDSKRSPAMMLNSASLTRSVMGRVVSPGTDLSFLPLAVPAMTLNVIPRSSWPREYFHVTRSRAPRSLSQG